VERARTWVRRWLAGPIHRLSRTKGFVAVGARLFPRMDRLAFRLSGGRFIVSDLLVPVAMLTTTGHRSGQPRTVPIAAIPDGTDWLVVGSNFGQDHHPAWVRNLLADPRATVRRRGRRYPVIAARLEADERDQVWPELTRQWPPFDEYVERAGGAGREILLFRLRRR
jgi:deazaflavin-dependent oxidoreductase (nitroreductase family)